MSTNNILVTVDNNKCNTETTSVVINSSRLSIEDSLFDCDNVSSLEAISSLLTHHGNTLYRLNINNTSRDTLEEYVSQITAFHSSRLKLHIDKSLCIEFSIIKPTLNQCNIVYDKPNYEKTNKKNSPICSIITNLGDYICPLLLTDINHQQYKYKQFTDQTHNKLIFLKKYMHLVFDSSKYHGFVDILNDGKVETTQTYLLINLWSYPLDNIPYYSSAKNISNYSTQMTFTDMNKPKHTESVDASSLNYEFFERMLYGNVFIFDDQFVTNIHNSKASNIQRVVLQIKKQTELDTVSAVENNHAYDYKNDKRFIQRFICPNLFPEWICLWLTREFKAVINNIDSSPNVIDISGIPNIAPFIFANIPYIMDKMKGFYCINNSIVDIQFIKFIKYKVFCDEKVDDKFDEKSLLRICICISNNKTDGHIMFDDNISVNLGLGSMLVHLNNIKFNRSPVIQGEEVCVIIGIILT
jgi:hypothetical protein